MWEKVKKIHIIKAIEEFNNNRRDFTKSKNTFLIFNKIKYPAKYIRGLAYKIANGIEISTEKYNGGKETQEFFKKLGFEVEYIPENKSNKVSNFEQNNSNYTSIENSDFLSNNKIVRIINSGKYDNKKLTKNLENFIKKYYLKSNFDFIVTYGGFLEFKIPFTFNSLNEAEEKYLPKIYEVAEKEINIFFENINKDLYKKLSNISPYITIGIDGLNKDYYKVELVAIFDFKKNKVVHWTGKSYPTEQEKNYLIKINDLNSHFIEINKQKILILGCHDLNIYSPRGIAKITEKNFKYNISLELRNSAKNFQPDIVIQHPHYTDSHNIWFSSWNNLVKELQVDTFVSGINYYNLNGKQRVSIDKVLEKTKSGHIDDYINN